MDKKILLANEEFEIEFMKISQKNKEKIFDILGGKIQDETKIYIKVGSKELEKIKHLLDEVEYRESLEVLDNKKHLFIKITQ